VWAAAVAREPDATLLKTTMARSDRCSVRFCGRRLPSLPCLVVAVHFLRYVKLRQRRGRFDGLNCRRAISSN